MVPNLSMIILDNTTGLEKDKIAWYSNKSTLGQVNHRGLEGSEIIGVQKPNE